MRWSHQMMMTSWWCYGVCKQLAGAGYTVNPGKYSLTTHHGNFSVVRTYSTCYRVLSAWQFNGSPQQFWSLTTHHGNFSVVRTCIFYLLLRVVCLTVQWLTTAISISDYSPRQFQRGPNIFYLLPRVVCLTVQWLVLWYSSLSRNQEFSRRDWLIML